MQIIKEKNEQLKILEGTCVGDMTIYCIWWSSM